MAERLKAAGMRVALGIEYDGSGYSGWQTQLAPPLATVQQTLEQALTRIADHPINVACAGRTDAGVHASGQVVHFDTTAERPLKAWVQGSNSLLPSSLVVRWAQAVAGDFHARFSATARRYRYVIANTPVRPALQAHFLTHHARPLEAALMHEAGQLLLGERDFSSFRAAGCQSRSTMRHVAELVVSRHGDRVQIDIEANAFLLHMVRNIVGTLFEIGEGRKPVSWAGELLALRDRTRAAPTAPAAGLTLVAVRYPERFGLPVSGR